MTLDQIKAAAPTQGYTPRYGSDSGPWTTSMFVEAVYQSLTQGKTGVSTRHATMVALLAAASLAATAHVHGQRGGPPGTPPPAPKAAAPIDLTGYWVSVVTEDWRYRMVTPTRGDYQGVPMTPDAVKIADAWDPAADTAAGNQCKSYGAAAIMRVPMRVHITWQDDSTLRLDTDTGTQTRLFHFDASQAKGEPSWQGESTAQWETPGAGAWRTRRQPGDARNRFAQGRDDDHEGRVPAEERRAVQRERDADRVLRSSRASADGDQLLVVTAIVDDAKYLRQPFIVSSQFKKQADGTGWDPTPCSATW